jgi:thiamine biosynthesis lipoprotein
LAAVDAAASRFRTDSELSTLNTAGGAPVVVSPLLAQALRVALDAAAWTQGLVDPTVGQALRNAGYDRTFDSVPADAPAFSVMCHPAPGWRRVELDDATRTVRVPRDVVLDLGATAKALAADVASEEAADAAGCGVLVSLGGDVSVAGGAPEGGWPVRIGDRADPETAVDAEPGTTVAITSGGLATSGTSARRWRRGGTWLHHIIDPTTGTPAVTPWRTVSVAAPTCALANTASTAAVILGADGPGWLAARGLPARLVATDGKVTGVLGWPGPLGPSSEGTSSGGAA